MTFNLVENSPSSDRAGPGRRGTVPGYRLLHSMDGPEMLVRNIPEIVGSDIANAAQSTDQANNPNIVFRLNANGARKFYETTRKKHRPPLCDCSG